MVYVTDPETNAARVELNRKHIAKQIQGKKNKARGRAFELKVRKHLEKLGYTVAKWPNNLSLVEEDIGEYNFQMHPAKQKFNPFRKAMSMGTGFPDFIAFKRRDVFEKTTVEFYCGYDVFGIEAKSGNKNHKYLDKHEKSKCEWYLKNKIFTGIWIAQKGKKRGSIEFQEYEV